MAIEKLGPVQLRVKTRRRGVATGELACRTRVATQQLHVPSLSGAVQLDCAAGFTGRNQMEVQCKHRTSVCLYM